MSPNATKFTDANKTSPVIAGSVASHETGGAVYHLENGLTFKLTRDECREIGMPKWKGLKP